MTAYLTPRERQVCDMLVQGMNGKEIAGELGISWRTVEEHRHNILTKYEVRGVVNLVRAVYGLGDPPARHQGVISA